MIVQALRPGTAELARRWLAALLVVPEAEREGVVSAVERRIVSTFGSKGAAPSDDDRPAREFRVVSPPRQREGYIEQIESTFVVRESKPARRGRGKAAG